MSNEIFSQEELKHIAGKLDVLMNNLNVSDEIISTEKQFNALYEKSRGCISEDNWCLFFTKSGYNNSEGILHRFSLEGIKMIADKYNVDLK